MTTDQDPAATAANYVPPSAVVNNADIQAYVQQQVQAAIAQAQAAAQAANAPVVQSPEEAARSAIDARGVGKGIEETKDEIYRLLHLIALKVGI